MQRNQKLPFNRDHVIDIIVLYHWKQLKLDYAKISTNQVGTDMN